MNKPQVMHWDVRDGELREQSIRAKLMAMGYRCSRYDYSPATYFPPHSHNVDKIDAVLAGRFCLTLFGCRCVLAAGDRIVVPKGIEHSAEVIGDQVVISIDAVKD